MSAPRPTPEDLMAWGRLISQAERMAQHPTIATEDLRRACKAAHAAVVPAGVMDRSNAFFLLLDLCRRVCLETMIGRAGSAPELIAAIEAADVLRRVERPASAWGAVAEPPPRPFRADIDG